MTNERQIEILLAAKVWIEEHESCRLEKRLSNGKPFYGLCNTLSEMNEEGTISFHEYYEMKNTIYRYGYRNKLLNYEYDVDQQYYWKVGVKEPRLQFIEDRLKALRS